MITERQKYLICGALVIISFVCGRFSSPDKVVTEAKTETAQIESQEKDLRKDQSKIVIETKKPDGTDITETKYETVDDVIHENTDEHKTTQTDTKTETRDSSQLSLELLGGVEFSPAPQFIYGMSFEKQIIGPFLLGGWFFVNGSFGASVGIKL